MHPHTLLELGSALLSRVLRFEHPADATVADFFRQQGALGSRERALLADAVFAVLRDRPRLQWLAFIDHGGAFPYRPGNLKGIQRDDFLTGVGVGAVLEWRSISMRMVLAAPLRRDHPSELHPSDLRLNAFFNISLQ